MPSDKRDDTEAAVGRVTTERGTIKGTCYSIGPEQVITCHHVRRQFKNVDDIRVRLGDGIYFVEDVDEDKALDACLLRLDVRRSATACLIPTTDAPPEGAEFRAYGYPARLKTYQRVREVPGHVHMGLWQGDETVAPIVALDAVIDRHDNMSGMSGAPILVDGRVVGHIISGPRSTPHETDPDDEAAFNTWGLVFGCPMSQILQRFDAKLDLPHDTRKRVLISPRTPAEWLEQYQDARHPSDEEACEVATQLIWSGGRWIDDAITVLKVHQSTRARQLLALAFKKLGDPRSLNSALAIMEVLYEQHGMRDEETHGIYGGLLKSRVYGTNLKQRPDCATERRQCHKVYADGFRRHPQSHYLGVNALFLKVCDPAGSDRDATLALASKVAEAAIQIPDSIKLPWAHASHAEAALVKLLLAQEGSVESVAAIYAKAVASSSDEMIRVMRLQVRRYLAHFHRNPYEYDWMFGLRTVVFTGHRVGARLAASDIPAVTERLAKVLEHYHIDHAVCSAADGGDLLFLRELLARGGSANVVLPFDPREFCNTSVKPEPDGGIDWRGLFEDIRNHARVDVTDLKLPHDNAAFAQCNRRMLTTVHSQVRDSDRLAIALWDGEAGKPGGTGEFLSELRQAGWRVVWVPIDATEVCELSPTSSDGEDATTT